MPESRIFVTHWFRRFARKERIGDDALCDAVERAEQGLIDADLGGGLIKQRIARKGQGRSGGYRGIIAFRSEERAVFVYGFAKSDRENLSPDERAQYVKLAGKVLAMSDSEVDELVADDRWRAVLCNA